MLLAASTLTVVFVGLISHVQLPNTTLSTAVLPDDHSHRALLIFKRADVIGSIDTLLCPLVAADCRVPLANTHVMISGMPRVRTDLTAVEEVIPSLTTISTCKYLKAAISRRVPADELTAFVDYSGGALVPRSYFKKMGVISDLPGWDVPRCMGCEVELRANLADDAATVTLVKASDTRQIVFQSGAEITVSNAYRNADAASNAIVPPFFAYFDIFDDRCQMPRVEVDGACQRSAVCNMPELPSPASTQSRFP